LIATESITEHPLGNNTRERREPSFRVLSVLSANEKLTMYSDEFRIVRQNEAAGAAERHFTH